MNANLNFFLCLTLSLSWASGFCIELQMDMNPAKTRSFCSSHWAYKSAITQTTNTNASRYCFRLTQTAIPTMLCYFFHSVSCSQSEETRLKYIRKTNMTYLKKQSLLSYSFTLIDSCMTDIGRLSIYPVMLWRKELNPNGPINCTYQV